MDHEWGSRLSVLDQDAGLDMGDTEMDEISLVVSCFVHLNASIRTKDLREETVDLPVLNATMNLILALSVETLWRGALYIDGGPISRLNL